MSSSTEPAAPVCAHAYRRPVDSGDSKCLDCGLIVPRPNYVPAGGHVPTVEQMKRETQG